MRITKGRIPTAVRTVIYGPAGIGKSTFASKFPDPLFIDTEGGTRQMDVARTEDPRTWDQLLQLIREVIAEKPCKTLVIDTADWAEKLCITQVCQNLNVKGIESVGYGKGYTYLAEEFQRMLKGLDKVIESGINVVVCAHAQMRKFEQPDEIGAYDRWELKLEKKTAPLLKEWADNIFFVNYKTIVITTQNNTKKAQGGQRVMYTTHNPVWDAKNRFGLPDELPFDFKQIEHIFTGNQQDPIKVVQDIKKEIDDTGTVSREPYDEERQKQWAILKENMNKFRVSPEELEKTIAKFEWFPADTRMTDYPTDFLEYLNGDWENFMSHIETKEDVNIKL